MTHLRANLQRSPHLLLGGSKGEHVVVLVTAVGEASGAQQGYVSGAEVLQGAAMGVAAVRGLARTHVHHTVRPERLLLLVFLEVPGAQRHFALQAGFGGRRGFIDAMVAQNAVVVLGHLRGPVIARLSSADFEAFDDAAELEVPLQRLHIVELLATLGALIDPGADLTGHVGRRLDASSAVVVSAGQHHGVGEELEADGTAELKGQQLLWLRQRHDC